MKGFVLAGGEGSRFKARKEKQLARIGDKRLIDMVIDSLKSSRLDKVYVAVSGNSPETWKYCRSKGYNLLRTRGNGYINDLKDITRITKPPFLTAASDIPFIKPEHINKVIDNASGSEFKGGWTVVVPEELFPSEFNRDDTFTYMGIDVAPVGLNIVGERQKDKKILTFDSKLAININTVEDLDYARKRI